MRDYPVLVGLLDAIGQVVVRGPGSVRMGRGRELVVLVGVRRRARGAPRALGYPRPGTRERLDYFRRSAATVIGGEAAHDVSPRSSRHVRLGPPEEVDILVRGSSPATVEPLLCDRARNGVRAAVAPGQAIRDAHSVVGVTRTAHRSQAAQAIVGIAGDLAVQAGHLGQHAERLVVHCGPEDRLAPGVVAGHPVREEVSVLVILTDPCRAGGQVPPVAFDGLVAVGVVLEGRDRDPAAACERLALEAEVAELAGRDRPLQGRVAAPGVGWPVVAEHLQRKPGRHVPFVSRHGRRQTHDVGRVVGCIGRGRAA